jgi:hypothetical protein
MAECDLHTLIEAQRIKKDGKRYKAAMTAHAEQMKTLMAVEAEKGGKKMMMGEKKA